MIKYPFLASYPKGIYEGKKTQAQNSHAWVQPISLSVLPQWWTHDGDINAPQTRSSHL
jgi:hypothetical protein